MNRLLNLMASLIVLVWGNTLWANENYTSEPQTTTCANCHGVNGINQELEGPNLAGQNHLYLIKQLSAFSEGARIHPLLSSDDLTLDSEEIVNLASYYASLKPEAPLNKSSADAELMYSTCEDCHGAQGEGISPFPRLSGQKPDYLEQQLVNFKTGVRQSATMQSISINLSDEEIKQLATYLGSQNTRDEVIANKSVFVSS